MHCFNKKAKLCVPSQNILQPKEQNAQSKSKRYVWEDGSLVADNDAIRFYGTNILPDDILELQTPLQFFRYFFTSEVITYIADQTNIYSAQQRPEKPMKVSAKEVETFLGVCLFMSLIKLSSCKNYWSNKFCVEQIARVMNF